ncbi:hypothetical protein [Fodinibius halophilus]|uniref:Uncharacterized protein n=1 Tax=Fodinibius halophilus TaxID=1736908 RepID=A0A6M1TBD5_9BACT|nr:hypothetical protein [Fodinibius halophilus]NGP87612.1 hypothetical protein [Fodinibius halophilus]
MKYYLLCVVFGMLLITGCKDSGTDAGNEGELMESLGVRVVNTGSGDLEVKTDGEASIDFCYENSGCEELSGGSFHTIFEGQSSEIDYSSPDKKAVGVKVSFHVTKGSGKTEIVEGRTYRDDAGFLEFEEGEVLHTASSFKEGDIVTFEYGDTGS